MKCLGLAADWPSKQATQQTTKNLVDQRAAEASRIMDTCAHMHILPEHEPLQYVSLCTCIIFRPGHRPHAQVQQDAKLQMQDMKSGCSHPHLGLVARNVSKIQHVRSKGLMHPARLRVDGGLPGVHSRRRVVVVMSRIFPMTCCSCTSVASSGYRRTVTIHGRLPMTSSHRLPAAGTPRHGLAMLSTPMAIQAMGHGLSMLKPMRHGFSVFQAVRHGLPMLQAHSGLPVAEWAAGMVEVAAHGRPMTHLPAAMTEVAGHGGAVAEVASHGRPVAGIAVIPIIGIRFPVVLLVTHCRGPVASHPHGWSMTAIAAHGGPVIQCAASF